VPPCWTSVTCTELPSGKGAEGIACLELRSADLPEDVAAGNLYARIELPLAKIFKTPVEELSALLKRRLTSVSGAELEAYIISWNLILRYRGLEGLWWRGLEQLYLLQVIPSEYLTDRGARYLAELERKFPGVRAREEPLRIEAQFVGSPIDEEAHAKMSDKA
jgi:hypothetical protein